MSSLSWRSKGVGTELMGSAWNGAEVGNGNELRCMISEGVVDEDDRLVEVGSIDYCRSVSGHRTVKEKRCKLTINHDGSSKPSASH